MKSACRDDQEMIVTLRTKGMWTMRSVAGFVAADARVSPKAPVTQLGEGRGIRTNVGAWRRRPQLRQHECPHRWRS